MKKNSFVFCPIYIILFLVVHLTETHPIILEFEKHIWHKGLTCDKTSKRTKILPYLFYKKKKKMRYMSFQSHAQDILFAMYGGNERILPFWVNN